MRKLAELLIQRLGAKGTTSEKLSRLSVLLRLEGQTEETARDKDMGVYNSK